MVLLLQVRLVVSETKIFLVRVVQILFYDVQNRRKVYNVCCHYNDLVQKVTLKCLNNTSFVN